MNYFDAYLIKTATALYRVSACEECAAIEKARMIENDKSIVVLSITNLTQLTK